MAVGRFGKQEVLSMLDSEIYGLIVALGVLLAMLFVAVLCIFYMKENARLKRRYRDNAEMLSYVKKERVKVYALILLELVLAIALLLVKEKLF